MYWIFFSGLLVCEQFGLLPIFIGNTLCKSSVQMPAQPPGIPLTDCS